MTLSRARINLSLLRKFSTIAKRTGTLFEPFSALESYGKSRVISLDISKAFDRVWQKGLLAKLPMFGLHHTLIKWIASFLSNRSIAIRIDGFLSKPHSINSGAPHGSVFSPFLFMLLINHLLSSTSFNFCSFADDTYLSSSFSSNR